MNTENLHILTNDTIKEIRNLDVVTPEIYKNIFCKKAIEKHIQYIEKDDDDFVITHAIEKLESLNKKTQENASSLKEHIDSAKTAIENEDIGSLTEVKSKVSDLEKRIYQLEVEIFLDELTNTHNRKWLFDKCLKDDKFKDNGTLIFIDINDFKTINDSYGHIVGDKILAMISTILKSIKDSEVLRYGGDEFIIVSNDKNVKLVENICEEKNKMLLRKSIKYKDSKFKVSMSYGIAGFKKGDNFKDVIEKADYKMYDYKKEIKERLC